MAIYVLGAPGSGKSSVRAPLSAALPEHVVIDWDDFMEPASALAGADIRLSPDTWSSYQALIRAAVVSAGAARAVVFGVCTPDELASWPIEQWILLDCTDIERTRRLASRPHDLGPAIEDAAAYRQLGLATIDTTDMAPDDIAAALVAAVRSRF